MKRPLLERSFVVYKIHYLNDVWGAIKEYTVIRKNTFAKGELLQERL
jgi:hypothetical protein